MNLTVPAPLPQDMQQLLNRLHEDGYEYVASLSNRVEVFAAELARYEAFKTFVSRCVALSRQVNGYLRLRRLVLIPYLHDLVSKEEDGHDCRDCGSRCAVRHSDYVRSIREAHNHIRALIFGLQAEGAPASGDAEYPDACRMLRMNMVLLNNTLMEILFIEETTMIPMMVELQQKIGAHG